MYSWIEYRLRSSRPQTTLGAVPPCPTLDDARAELQRRVDELNACGAAYVMQPSGVSAYSAHGNEILSIVTAIAGGAAVPAGFERV
jgi:hypothetical protein